MHRRTVQHRRALLAGKRGITLDTAARLAEPLKLTLKRRHARPAKDKEATQC